MKDDPLKFAYRVSGAESLDDIRPYGSNSECITHLGYHVSLMKRLLLPLNPESGKYSPRRQQEKLGSSWSASPRRRWTSLTASAPSLRVAAARLIRCLSKNAAEVAELGSELVRHALAWMESAGASSKTVTVACANEEALAFYRRLGFHPRSILLQQGHETAA